MLTATLLADADEFVTTMHHAIHSLVAATPTVTQLLAWAHVRTRQVNVSVELHGTIQLAYILLARERVRPLLLAFAIKSERASTLALSIFRALGRAFTSEIAQIIVRQGESAIDLDLSRASALARTLDLDLAISTTPLVDFDYGLYYALVYATLFAGGSVDHKDEDWRIAMQELPSLVEGVAALADEAGLGDLSHQLIGYSIPAPSAARQDWQQYADGLFAILRDQRDLGREWNFSPEDFDKLNDYFYANELLVQCLKVAVVSDRQAVLQGLLLPPGAGEGDKVKG